MDQFLWPFSTASKDDKPMIKVFSEVSDTTRSRQARMDITMNSLAGYVQDDITRVGAPSQVPNNTSEPPYNTQPQVPTQDLEFVFTKPKPKPKPTQVQVKANSSGYKGVCYHSKARKYQATLYNPNTKGNIHLGLFESAEDAAHVYDRAALYLKGNMAKLNFPAIYGARQSNDDSSSSSRRQPTQRSGPY